MTAAEYIAGMRVVLGELRPELLTQLRGRWEGSHELVDAPSGLWFYGPARLKACVSPWDAADADAEKPPMWLHVSVSTPTRCPTYDELLEVRNRFFRADDTVVHVWPPSSEHYNHHPFCLHLWARTDGQRPLPDLRGAMGGV